MKFFALLCLAATAAFAEDSAESAKVAEPKEVAPGVFEIGSVRLDKNARTVTFPAKVNMVDGLVEYLCVTPLGSTHESVLVSDAGPQNVHLAMLLLGAKGAAPADPKAVPDQINAEYLANMPKIAGDRVILAVKWKGDDGAEHTAPAERWVEQHIDEKNQPTKKLPMSDGPWTYNGSYIYSGQFIAQVDGMYVSIAAMQGALINNPRDGANNDQMWFANTKALPPVGTLVEFTIKLEPPQKPQK